LYEAIVRAVGHEQQHGVADAHLSLESDSRVAKRLLIRMNDSRIPVQQNQGVRPRTPVDAHRAMFAPPPAVGKARSTAR
jgi:hypothetical protein